MDQQKWKDFYLKDLRKNLQFIFVKVMTSDSKHFFFKENDYDEWYKIKNHCENNGVYIKDFEIQCRSNQQIVDTGDCDGFYFVRSVLGQMGADSRRYFTFGKYKKGIVQKKMMLIPELIVDNEYEDPLENCFTEALIVYDKKTKNREE